MTYVRLAAAILIMLVWAAVYIAAILDPRRHAPGEVTAVAVIAATYLLGAEAASQMRRRKNGVSTSTERPPAPEREGYDR